MKNERVLSLSEEQVKVERTTEFPDLLQTTLAGPDEDDSNGTNSNQTSDQS